ncbi:hypothetical protein [Williamsia sp. CHRR-6]|uniref:hypothetical protein n=1 Tax=Williamsia sp. CHRR-6 TaxID=2835871 RepID=UPI001BDA5956|nr:hypothetical protein [Williamsia sp. CHRR-6]MBT0567304.1 hypothetical protein [Williamsia sp. CHRR-6]
MPSDPEYAARRRALIRQHHPDVGGDPERLRIELERLDREFARPHSAPARPRARTGERPVVRPSSQTRVIARRLAAQIRAIRGRLPRSVPGSKRYFDI